MLKESVSLIAVLIAVPLRIIPSYLPATSKRVSSSIKLKRLYLLIIYFSMASL
jgi:hypothetical protein